MRQNEALRVALIIVHLVAYLRKWDPVTPHDLIIDNLIAMPERMQEVLQHPAW